MVKSCPKKSVEVNAVGFEEYSDPDFKFPSNFYYIDALSNRVFVKVSNRKAADQYIVSEYGYMKYKIVSQKNEKGGDKILGAAGFVNSKSRSGTYLKQIRNNQARF